MIIGSDDDEVRDVMAQLYAPFILQGGERLVFMDEASAELTKYAANAMLATRISFMNEIARLCEAVGADVSRVRHGIGSDRRIGRAFLYPGPGYGGSCFPKDMKAILRTGRDAGIDLELLRAVESVNDRQKRELFERVRRALGDAGWRVPPSPSGGSAFQADPDDLAGEPGAWWLFAGPAPGRNPNSEATTPSPPSPPAELREFHHYWENPYPRAKAPIPPGLLPNGEISEIPNSRNSPGPLGVPSIWKGPILTNIEPWEPALFHISESFPINK